MATATVTAKGQITIPNEVRKALGLKPGVRIDFFRIDEKEYSLRPRTGSIMDLKGCLAEAGSGLSIKEMDEAVMDHAVALDKASMSDAHEDQAEGEPA